MATIGAIAVTGDWTKVYDGLADGAFCGAIQSLANGVVSVRVETGNVPPTVTSGFNIGSQITPIKVLATESVWARALNGSGSVILG